MLFACSKAEAPQEVEIESEILGLIAIGMNIDKARNKLIEKGFKVGQKYYPTKEKSYYQMDIPLVSQLPASETFRYATNMKSGDKKIHIVVFADTKGYITKIE